MFTVICVFNKTYKIYYMEDLLDAMDVISENYTDDMIESNIFCDGVLIMKTLLK